jgi:hypothetical protein
MARFDLVATYVPGALTAFTYGRLELSGSAILSYTYSDQSTVANDFARTYLPNPLTVFAADAITFTGQNFNSSAVSVSVALTGIEFDALSWAP